MTSSQDTYECTLNQADITNNANKFYTMKIVDSTKVEVCYGRVGTKGKTLIKDYSTKLGAIHAFKKQFKTKTGYNWSEKHESTEHPKKGKYAYIDVEREESVPLSDDLNDSVAESVKLAIRDICNKEMMVRTILSFGINSDKLPLGKLKKSQIQKAHAILSKLKTEIGSKRPKERVIEDLSSQFWTIIPYACSSRIRPPLIQNEDFLQKCSDMLYTLDNIQTVSSNLGGKTLSEVYDSLGVEFTPISQISEEYKIIKNYVSSTHGPTHTYKLEILDIFHIDYDKEIEEDNNYLLFHGTRLANMMSILTNGFRIPSKDQVVNGSVLGRGCYFADSVSKSFNYCNPEENTTMSGGSVGYLLLCEVALGKSEVVTYPTYDVPMSNKYASRMAKGQTGIDDISTTVLDSCEVPIGEMEIRKNYQGSFLYNEYVVYDTNRYRFKYLLKLKKVNKV